MSMSWTAHWPLLVAKEYQRVANRVSQGDAVCPRTLLRPAPDDRAHGVTRFLAHRGALHNAHRGVARIECLAQPHNAPIVTIVRASGGSRKVTIRSNWLKRARISSRSFDVQDMSAFRRTLSVKAGKLICGVPTDLQTMVRLMG
jgi:hypothetical protein